MVEWVTMTQSNSDGQYDPAEPTQVTPGGTGATEYLQAQNQHQSYTPQTQYGAGQYNSGQYSSGQYGGYSGPVPQQPGHGGYGQYQAAPVAPSAFSKIPVTVWLAITSGIAGIVTYFMGIAPWVVADEDLEGNLEDWVADQSNCSVDEIGYENCDFEVGIPAFSSPSLILSPGFFFIVLGIGALTSLAVALPKLRKYAPIAALITATGFLAMLAAFMGTPVLKMGAGAITGLIFAILQLLLIGAAVVLDGLKKPQQPAGSI